MLLFGFYPGDSEKVFKILLLFESQQYIKNAKVQKNQGRSILMHGVLGVIHPILQESVMRIQPAAASPELFHRLHTYPTPPLLLPKSSGFSRIPAALSSLRLAGNFAFSPFSHRRFFLNEIFNHNQGPSG
jgi:hypothetical protein